MIISRKNISELLFKEKETTKKEIINLVAEVCKRNGIGSPQEKQSISYADAEVDVLRKIVHFLFWIHENECRNFRTNEETVVLIDYLVKALTQKSEILFFALFCPSYKKSKSEVGFNTAIGDTTKRGIENLSRISKKVKSLGIQCSVQAIFSDLALENFQELREKDFKHLEENFKAFVQHGKSTDSSMQFLKLSEIGACKTRIGVEGIAQGKILLSEMEIYRIALRSFSFYRDILGWKEEEVVKRTRDLARSCSAMVSEIKQSNPYTVMVMTENIYERGLLYHPSIAPIPIFYPKKHDRMKILVVGSPLSGKSTLASHVSSILHLPHISAGRLIDAFLKGSKIKIDHNDTTSTFDDDTILNLIEERIQLYGKDGFVMEGFPKYKEEFSLFDQKWGKIDILFVIGFNEKISLERTKNRLICPHCAASFHTENRPPKRVGICDLCSNALIQREDDDEQMVRIRLAEYQELEKDLLHFLQARTKKVIFLEPNFDINKITVDFINENG